MTMPSSGWEMVMDRGPKPEIAVLRFLLPVSVLSGVSDFFNLIYMVDCTFTELLVSAVITFCSFFIGYYLSLVFCKLLLPKDAGHFPVSPYGKLIILFSTATLAFFHILMQAIPMFDFIFEFLPIWTVYLIYKGMKMVVVSAEKQTYAIGLTCIVTICSPFLIEWFLSLLPY